ncbi:MAG: conserved exported protein of unknown function [Nitrosopumilales archaeon]|nr:MAG: conserved exported protein of unknown function [Nitrosopumilales archaeon]
MMKKTYLALMIFALIAPASAYAVAGTITVNLEGTPVDVSFDSEGVEILSVETIDDAFGASLILEVKVTGSPGILEIILERNFIDAKYQGDDDLFFVLVDGEDLNFQETETTSESRTLRITLPEGTEEVEIIGTEFGEPDMMEEETMEEEEEETMEEEEEETMEEEEERTQCGPGTVLKEGVCVLEQKCGPGTILQDGVCVVSPSASTGEVSISRDLIVGAGAALVISFILMLVLGAVARAGRNKS